MYSVIIICLLNSRNVFSQVLAKQKQEASQFLNYIIFAGDGDFALFISRDAKEISCAHN